MTDKPIRPKRRGRAGRAGGAGGAGPNDPRSGRAARAGRTGRAGPNDPPATRYRRLPAGTHGIDPELVREDQARRLRTAIVELIAAKGYPAVRIADLARLAHVSPPTLYSLYANKEQLLACAYEDVARRVSVAIAAAHRPEDPPPERLLAALNAFCALAAEEPHAISLLLLGAFGAGAQVRHKRRLALDALEAYVHANRSPHAPFQDGDLVVAALVGGIREVTANRLRDGRHAELPQLAPVLSSWAASYPPSLPAGLAAPPASYTLEPGEASAPPGPASRTGRPLPSGRSELPREVIVKSQRERIVDATAAIVAEKGLAALTIPEIVKRASVSNETFYAIYPSKDAAFLGAQEIGMRLALRVTVTAFEGGGKDWPCSVRAGIRALLQYLVSEPEHAHLTLVDTFAASPEALAIRDGAMGAFRDYLAPGVELARERGAECDPTVAAEAVAGGIWQLLHRYIDRGAIRELPKAAPQLTYFALTPFLGAQAASDVARAKPAS